MFYVYVWRDANGVPFYVGKGSGRRAFNVSPSRRSKAFIKIYDQGGCTVEIVDYFIHESQAHAHEVDVIARFGCRHSGGILVNRTAGGEGVSGLTLSESAREKISKKLAGRTLSEQTRRRISASKTNPSEETRAKISAANTGLKRSDETKSRMSLAQSRAPRSAEVRSSISRGKRFNRPLTGLKGVSAHKMTGKWQAAISVGGKRKYLGLFITTEEAAIAYDAEAYAVWGADCYLNFPNRIGVIP